MVESALIFETNYGGTHAGEGARWHTRFDCIMLVDGSGRGEDRAIRGALPAPAQSMTEERRAELEAEARRRLAQQIPDEQKSALSDYVLTNDGAVTELEWQVDQLWPILQAAAGSALQTLIEIIALQAQLCAQAD